ncbi:hypothetical protein CEXT_638661 [Caerostris extrusa]|uniref:Uncharacterized protein n=1 Tax=Caerostris extrusa TaxID=172846 RepID=A0AAV4XJ79_CAEEX|nr:hypothetical protein CEXT_638661 [Caerostris extrusa]
MPILQKTEDSSLKGLMDFLEQYVQKKRNGKSCSYCLGANLNSNKKRNFAEKLTGISLTAALAKLTNQRIPSGNISIAYFAIKNNLSRIILCSYKLES